MSRRILVLVSFVLLILLVSLASLCLGTVELSPAEVFHALVTGEGSGVIRTIRLPRLLLALVLGAALSLSGFLLQTFFANPLAGPYVLGISSAAKTAVALQMVFAGSAVMNAALSAWSMALAAFVGALASTLLILLLSERLSGMPSLLVLGIMIGYIAQAVTELITSFARDADIIGLHVWTRGSFSGAGWMEIRISAGIFFVAFVLSMLLSKGMNAYRLGEDYARSVGVNLKRLRTGLILLSSALSACVTAFAGPVSFVGIAVPVLARSLLGTADPRIVVPGTALLGAAFTAFSDLIARQALAPMEINLSAVTAILGAPVVIAVLLRRDGAWNS